MEISKRHARKLFDKGLDVEIEDDLYPPVRTTWNKKNDRMEFKEILDSFVGATEFKFHIKAVKRKEFWNTDENKL
jgi:hypothetical protein